jgi:hypothetical protein
MSPRRFFATFTAAGTSTRESDLTRLVVVLLWASLAVVQVQRLSADPIRCYSQPECRVGDPAPGCSCNQYLDSDTGRCENCLVCCQEGKHQISRCERDHNSVCSLCAPGVQFLDGDALLCRNCSVCASDEKQVAPCTTDRDTQCQPRCQDHQYYAAGLDRCFFNCELCQHGCTTSDTSGTKCQCQPSQCYLETDLLCETNQCVTTEPPPPDVTSTLAHRSNGLPTWGIGLISIGVVIGIVAFSAGSMILSFCTRKSPQTDLEMNEPGINTKPSMLTGRYINEPGALFHKHHPLFETGRKCGHYSPGSSTRSSSMRSGSIRTNSIRNSPKTHGVNAQSSRSENITPI